MSRIDDCFAKLAAEGSAALIPYIAAGDPHPKLTVGIMQRLAENGADLIELGVPFSDPMADGAIVQGAHERALKYNTRLHDVFAMVAEFRKGNDSTPVTLMSYLNPLESLGYKEFALAAAEAGVDGVLIVDMPPEENECRALFAQYGLEQIFLISPNSPESRLQTINEYAAGYLYYISIKGVTGSNIRDIPAIRQQLATIRKNVQLPLVVGFGIRSPNDIRELSSHCDGVVVGSALIETMQAHTNDDVALFDAIGRFVNELKAACRKEAQ
ncbi:MAG: tryptophan synthase subunit alpha [Candidatus Eutrophobiaceae bacterium]